VQILLIVHKDASPPSLAYSCLTPPEVMDTTFFTLEPGGCSEGASPFFIFIFNLTLSPVRG
jgi:hypothetical protein